MKHFNNIVIYDCNTESVYKSLITLFKKYDMDFIYFGKFVNIQKLSYKKLSIFLKSVISGKQSFLITQNGLSVCNTKPYEDDEDVLFIAANDFLAEVSATI